MNPPHFAKRPKPELPPDAPILVTAFTCGGLFEIGALYAGFRPVLGVEFYPAKGKKDDAVKQRQSASAADNYERNFGPHIIRKTIEDAVRDRDFCNYRPKAFHCSPSCTNLSQGNTQGSEDDGDVSAATAITHAITQLGYPKIFTLENVEAYLKSKSWQIIRNFLYANGYGVAEDVVWASDYGNLETGEGVPQDRKRLIVRAVKGHFAPPLPPKVAKRMGWYCAIADLIDELPDGELAPWQLQRLPQLVKDLLIDPNNPSRNYTTKEVTEPSFTITATHARRPITTPCAYLVRNDNTKQEWGKGYREDEEPSVTVTATFQPSAVITQYTVAPSALLLNGQNASNAIASHKEPQESSYTVTAGAKWSNILLIERGGASDQRITTRTPDEPAWTIRSSIGTDQDGRNRNEVMNVLVGYRVKKLNARAIARLQSVPDWYQLPEQMKDAGPLIGNGVPSLLSEAVMRSLLPYVQQPTSTCFVDAVGSGPCFGPVVACAVVLKPGMEEQLKSQGITDSKAIIKSTTPQTKREQIWQSILPAVEHYAIAYATAAEINSLGMGEANRLAMKRAVDKIRKRVQVGSIIVDGEDAIAGYETISTPVVKADQKYPGVSAASCLAKIFRDGLVTRLWDKLPYGLSQHKGYSTEVHKAALIEHGLHSQHHINNGFVKQYGIRQPNNAAGQKCEASVSRTTAINLEPLTTPQISNRQGIGASGVRGGEETPGHIQIAPPTFSNEGGDSSRGRLLEAGQETITQTSNLTQEKPMVATPIEILSKQADEQYTPNTKDQPVVDLVVQVLGAIGVDVTADPSHAIPATHHITQADNYLTTSAEGMGTAFMNPPYSCPLPFVQKLCEDFEKGHITEAIALLKAGTAHNQGTGALIKQHASAQCQWGVHTGRIGFIKDGVQRKGADFDCTLYYFGSNWQRFKEIFDPWGLVSLLPKAQNQLVHISNFLERRQAQPDDSALTTDVLGVARHASDDSCQSDLSYDEQRDRIHLERKVDAAFYEAGKALMELRDRRLYRSTHPSWESYCQERFGFSHQNGDKKIAAAKVVDVLEQNGCQLLPSSGEQAYPLSKLVEDEQKVEVWEELTQEGKRPSGKKVRNVVAEICNRQAERGDYHNPWHVGDICQIFKKGDGTLAKYDGCWSIVSEVKTRQCLVKVWDGEVLVKAENLEELSVGDEFLAVCDRVRSLMSRHMDGSITLSRGNLRFLEALGEQMELFDVDDIEMLSCIEAKVNSRNASLVQAARLLADNADGLTDDEARSLFEALRSVHGF